MKNLHFYIQCAMLLLAGSIAVQLPFHQDLLGALIAIEVLIGIYQLGMSSMLMSKLSFKPLLLKIHFYTSWGYIFTLLFLGMSSPEWMTRDRWQIAFLVIPWAIAIFFLVALDEMERFRHYRL